VESETYLFQVVLALYAVRGFPHHLDGRQEQTNQNGNNGDDHKQFDKSEARAIA
jgi:hypothetical protein